jgi:uncharacterized protein YhbP (UPF0306 family)
MRDAHAMAEFTVEQILDAIYRHLAARHICTLATSQQDQPWAATCFYVPRALDLYVCQRKDARTLEQMRANPRTAFSIDDRKVEAWLQGLGSASTVTGADESWARAQLQQAAPEFSRHFTNPEYPILLIRADDLTFVDRPSGIVPRQHLRFTNQTWRIVP